MKKKPWKRDYNEALDAVTMPTPSQLPERLRMDDRGRFRNLYTNEALRIIGENNVALKLEMISRYNSHPTLLQELEELRKALRRVMEIDGPGLDLSPCGSCYDVAKQALSMTQK